MRHRKSLFIFPLLALTFSMGSCSAALENAVPGNPQEPPFHHNDDESDAEKEKLDIEELKKHRYTEIKEFELKNGTLNYTIAIDNPKVSKMHTFIQVLKDGREKDRLTLFSAAVPVPLHVSVQLVINVAFELENNQIEYIQEYTRTLIETSTQNQLNLYVDPGYFNVKYDLYSHSHDSDGDVFSVKSAKIYKDNLLIKDLEESFETNGLEPNTEYTLKVNTDYKGSFDLDFINADLVSNFKTDLVEEEKINVAFKCLDNSAFYEIEDDDFRDSLSVTIEELKLSYNGQIVFEKQKCESEGFIPLLDSGIYKAEAKLKIFDMYGFIIVDKSYDLDFTNGITPFNPIRINLTVYDDAVFAKGIIGATTNEITFKSLSIIRNGKVLEKVNNVSSYLFKNLLPGKIYTVECETIEIQDSISESIRHTRKEFNTSINGKTYMEFVPKQLEIIDQSVFYEFVPSEQIEGQEIFFNKVTLKDKHGDEVMVSSNAKGKFDLSEPQRYTLSVKYDYPNRYGQLSSRYCSYDFYALPTNFAHEASFEVVKTTSTSVQIKMNQTGLRYPYYCVIYKENDECRYQLDENDIYNITYLKPNTEYVAHFYYEFYYVDSGLDKKVKLVSEPLRFKTLASEGGNK